MKYSIGAVSDTILKLAERDSIEGVKSKKEAEKKIKHFMRIWNKFWERETKS